MKQLTVQYVNYWKDPFNDRWLLHFISNIFKNTYDVIEVKNQTTCDILISSVCGNINHVNKYQATLKIFYYGENLNRYPPYNDIAYLKTIFNLIIGFRPTDLDNNIIRFPLWFMYYPFFKMTNDEHNIVDYLNKQRNNNLKKNKIYLGCCIARHNTSNIRGTICDVLSKYGSIMYPSKFRRNCCIGPTTVDKINFLTNVKYNICPENSKYPGYYTEKIFHALESGCIPIYWAIDLPEKDILNPKCYIFADIENIENMELDIKRAVKNYDNIINEDMFTKNAKTVIESYYTILENNIKKFFKESNCS